jgi:uracil-DNA glycosylase
MSVAERLRTPITWREALSGEREKPYFRELISAVEDERRRGVVVYPPNNEVFHALSATEFEAVSVVILGQDPYHGPGQAHGLCFSVKPPTPPPPSLLNIFQELKADVGIQTPPHGCLEHWTKQGVLLLNAVLTVRAGEAGSHANRGWEKFTDRVIQELNERRNGLVFLLWGSYAQKKASFVDTGRHTVLTAPHPSPLSAHRGFLGCRHFSRTNQALVAQGRAPIDWNVVER